jgi:hypothetical protein
LGESEPFTSHTTTTNSAAAARLWLVHAEIKMELTEVLMAASKQLPREILQALEAMPLDRIYNCAMCCRHGKHGFLQDKPLELQYLNFAAERGYAPAQADLGAAYGDGIGLR